MKTQFLSLIAAFLCLQGCAEMPAYSNVGATTAADESRYTVVETDTYAGRPQRHFADGEANLNIIRMKKSATSRSPRTTTRTIRRSARC
jgi:hypothetical protein